MNITINNKFKEEKFYTLHVIFVEFLGLNVHIKINNDTENTYVTLENGNELILKDSFFQYHTNESYLSTDNLPKEVKQFEIKFNNETHKGVVLYGKPEIIIKPTKIECGIDIIASVFFMLSRWEEYVVKGKDKHNRFSAKSSIAYTFGFLNRPIVNEYVELLWNSLIYLGTIQKRKERKFQIIPTHDVDLPLMWWNFKDFVKTIAGDLIKRNDINGAFWSIKNYSKKLMGGKDPFDTFDYLMTLSERNNLKSHFFFMSGGTSNKDNFYKINHPIINDLINEINDRGHKIGFHPSYNAYNDTDQFAKELKKLNRYTPQSIKTGRNHFLRFEVPTTWQVWEHNNMEWDSSMSYADHEGFRCGTCYTFPVFDIINRKKMNLLEKPLIVMDGSLVTYQNLTYEEGYNKINNLVQEVKKYKGEFVFLWHNSAFNTNTWKPFQQIYERILNENRE